MNNTQLFKSFSFNLYQMQKYHHTDQVKTGGSPTNYIAKMLSGRAEIKSSHTTLHISEGDIFYIPRGLKYQSFWYGNEQEQISWLSFGFDALPFREDTFFTLQKINCSHKAAEILKKLSANLNVNCSSIGLLYQFLGEVTRDMERDNHPYDLVIEKALEFMQSNEEYRFKDVAEYCHVSESGLYGIFKKALKKTPVEIRQEIQCEKAIQLLTTTNLSVEEISSRLHFSSSSYFRKILKKHTGKTPLSIRREAIF